ncbi:hypothetical protein Bpfe_016394 [Biomphalaria pfeifferi]|uniref:Uncharacterized protein n=1 Tax=Biomphalaria pfeifferi TaxID=112525 RepID=A0AAD8BH65_BIOPF|nr:hypothetical protein Bpfe_016394 [Biomphalaria pfeifferi]
MNTTWKKSNEETCTKLEKMCTSVKEIASPVVKTMDVVEETPYDQVDLKDKGAAPSLNNELLPTQSFKEIGSNNGNADESGAACESETRSTDLKIRKRARKKQEKRPIVQQKHVMQLYLI